MKVLTITAILLLNTIFQSSLFPFIRIKGAAPDTLMMIVVSFALQTGSISGAIIGFSGGLIQDIIYGNSLGVYAVIYMLIGFFTGFVQDKIFIDNIFIPSVFTFLGSVLKGLMLMVYMFFLRSGITLGYNMKNLVLPEAIYTVLLTPLIYYWIFLLNRKKFMNRKWHFRRD
ncbi:MAG TPA: rod shape-determining protein MreD [Candidatus Atribacteria bacterium]|nr:rod shape-determining protein MreD [Candidatus Atribacteria bacterium]